MSTQFDVAVIGNGMIGAAASRYLSASGLAVAAIGPGEPENRQTHEGVFASHYDQGRITRIIDPNPLWGLMAKRSIEVYPELEAKSGLKFHFPVGQLRVSPDPTTPGDNIDASDGVGRELGAVYQRLQREQLAVRFPYLHFAAKAEALWEEGAAGFVNPRRLVQAQLTIASQQGATLIAEEVVGIERQQGEFTVVTHAGKRIRARKVLLATGGFTNLLLGRKLDLRPKAVSVVLAELGKAELARVQGLPTLIWRLEKHPLLESIYSVSPTLYPDGRVCFKIGGTLRQPIYLQTKEEFRTHFQSPGNAHEIAALREVTLDLLPGLVVESWQSVPCVTTYTAHKYPYIDAIEENLFVAVGGSGSAAKSSNEYGHIAARLVARGEWDYDVEASHFRACWAN